MSARIAVRLGLLVAIVVAGLAYLSLSVLQYRVGAQPFSVAVHMPRAGGLYAGGYVSYRGTTVGRVTSLDVSPAGVTAHLSLDPGTRIPVDTAVSVHDLSAVGEEYVDFVPRTGTGPYLHGGSVVTVAAGDVPLQVGSVLADTSRFASSVNTDDVSSLLDTLTQALQGSGPQLRTILTATQSLFADLQQVQPATVEDIQGGNALLQTGQRTNPDVHAFSTNLAQLSAQLKASNGDLQSLFAKGAAGADQVASLLAADGPALSRLVASGQTIAAVPASNVPAIAPLLEALPTVANDLAATYWGGAVNGAYFINATQPICTYTDNLPLPTAKATAPPVLTNTCKSTAPDLLQRGAANAPEPQP